MRKSNAERRCAIVSLLLLAACEVAIAGRQARDAEDALSEADAAPASRGDDGSATGGDDARAGADSGAPAEGGAGEVDADDAGGDACAPSCPEPGADAARADDAAALADPDGAPALDCAHFPVFDRACSTDADCALGARRFDCCGSALVTGVRVDRRDAFHTAAQRCHGTAPTCDCVPRPTRADDGTVDESTNASVPSVVCRYGQCWSSFATFSGRTPCGDEGDACEAMYEVCITRTPVGDGVANDCVSVPRECQGRHTCDCLAETRCDRTFRACSDGVFANNIVCACPGCD